jgi:hypothetical protein
MTGKLTFISIGNRSERHLALKVDSRPNAAAKLRQRYRNSAHSGSFWKIQS